MRSRVYVHVQECARVRLCVCVVFIFNFCWSFSVRLLTCCCLSRILMLYKQLIKDDGIVCTFKCVQNCFAMKMNFKYSGKYCQPEWLCVLLCVDSGRDRAVAVPLTEPMQADKSSSLQPNRSSRMENSIRLSNVNSSRRWAYAMSSFPQLKPHVYTQ